MRAILTPNEAVSAALNLVKKEIRNGLSPVVAISIVAGREGIDPDKLEYFYNQYNQKDSVSVKPLPAHAGGLGY